jgi:DNA (cytosine-5)-methyltransferase 1
LGFSRAGFEIVAHVEKDANCRKLLAAKWPDAIALDDVCTAGAHNLTACDVITFGFPCQDLSVAGKRAGLKGKRSGLFYEATRIINELRPAFCLFENVPGLLSSEQGGDFLNVLLEMDRIGYNGAWRVLDAQWFGVAQRRRRCFGLFSCLNSGAERCAEILSIPESLRGHPAPSREAGEEIAGSLDCRAAGGGFPGTDGACAGHVIPAVGATLKANTGRNHIECDYIPAVAGCLQERDAKGADSDTKPGHLVPVAFGGDMARTLVARHDSSPCADRGMDVVAVPVAFEPRFVRTSGGQPTTGPHPCLRADANTGDGKPCVATMMQVRRLTPTECERLQGFPDGWTAGFSDSTRYRMLGNAVAVPVAEWIAKRLAKSITQTETQL